MVYDAVGQEELSILKYLKSTRGIHGLPRVLTVDPLRLPRNLAAKAVFMFEYGSQADKPAAETAAVDFDKLSQTLGQAFGDRIYLKGKNIFMSHRGAQPQRLISTFTFNRRLPRVKDSTVCGDRSRTGR